MLNFLIKLRKGRYLDKSKRSAVVVFASLLSGALLFYFYGSAAYSRVGDKLSDMRFLIAYIVIFVLLMFSAFSQFGVLTVILADAAFEFFVLLFLSAEISAFSIKTVLLLSLQVFLIIAFTMLFSERAIALSCELAKKTVSDKKYFATVSANFLMFLAFLATFVIICITAF